MSVAVLDASALLALVQDEPGADRVQDALARGAAMSAVNWAETLSRLAEFGVTPESVGARLRQPTRHLKLSLGDRACLALGRTLGLPVLTTDRAWRGVGTRLKVGVAVIRL